MQIRTAGVKLYMISGEASGDLHGATLVLELLRNDPTVQIRGWGGDKMSEAGAEIVKHYRDLAYMGFVEVAKNLRTISRNFREIKKDIQNWNPRALILIDYPGFNLRIAKWAKARGIPVYYYISPQVWAWKESRVNIIRACVEKMFVILPFEKSFYKKHRIDVEFVGHPLVGIVDAFISKSKVRPEKHIALLPGSRAQEVKTMLPVMLSACEKFSDYQFIVAGTSQLPDTLYSNIIRASGASNIDTRFDDTYRALFGAMGALTTSGTATLETALLNIPQVVCYKGNALSYQIAKRLVKVKYISLVNLILDEPVVAELIQNELTPDHVVERLNDVLSEAGRSHIQGHYAKLRALLDNGNSAEKVAMSIIGDLS